MVRFRTPLVVFRLIDPAHDTLGVRENRGGNRESGNAGRTGMDALVADPEEVGDREVPVREHHALESVLGVTCQDLLRCICTKRHDLDAALVELRSEFFPSPQLGDTVPSPVSAKELQQYGLAGDAGALETFAILV